MLCWTYIATRWGCDMAQLTCFDGKYFDPTRVESVDMERLVGTDARLDWMKSTWVLFAVMHSGSIILWNYVEQVDSHTSTQKASVKAHKICDERHTELLELIYEHTHPGD